MSSHARKDFEQEAALSHLQLYYKDSNPIGKGPLSTSLILLSGGLNFSLDFEMDTTIQTVLPRGGSLLEEEDEVL